MGRYRDSVPHLFYLTSCHPLATSVFLTSLWLNPHVAFSDWPLSLSIMHLASSMSFHGSITHFFFSSVQFSCSVVSHSLRPHELQHARPPCPSPTPGVHSNSCPLSWRSHPAISSSVVTFSSCPQSLPTSGSFLMSQLFA